MWLFAALDVLLLIPVGRQVYQEVRKSPPGRWVVRLLIGLLLFGIAAAATVVFVGVVCMTLTG